MSHVRRLAAAAAIAIAARPIAAQTTRTVRSQGNAWLTLSSDVWLTPKIGIQTEALIQRSRLGAAPQQLELRTGLERALGSTARIAAGATFIHNSPYGPFPARTPFNEYRTWVQVQLEQGLTRVALAHRYRLEERWIERKAAAGGPTDLAFGLRVRYQFRATVPLTSKTNGYTPYVAASDEVFLVAGPHAPANLLDQNRAYAAIGVRWSSAFRSEVGYLNQAILRADGRQIENNHTLQIALNVNRRPRPSP